MATKKAAPKRAVGDQKRAAAVKRPAKAAKKSASEGRRRPPSNAAADASQRKKERKKNVVADSIDLRDRPYMPSVTVIPAASIPPPLYIPVLNQRETNACTGFALASVIYHLQYKAKREKQIPDKVQAVSPFMLYSMARRYDEFPGNPIRGHRFEPARRDEGLVQVRRMPGGYVEEPRRCPKPNVEPGRRLVAECGEVSAGRVLPRRHESVTDMQVALNEIGALYASAVCHTGWLEGENVQAIEAGFLGDSVSRRCTPSEARMPSRLSVTRKRVSSFTTRGTPNWGSGGRAILTYEDWTSRTRWTAGWRSLACTDGVWNSRLRRRRRCGGRRTACSWQAIETLRNRELDPFIIDMENNGRLSNTGDFRTQDSDVDALLNQHIGEARKSVATGR